MVGLLRASPADLAVADAGVPKETSVLHLAWCCFTSRGSSVNIYSRLTKIMAFSGDKQTAFFHLMPLESFPELRQEASKLFYRLDAAEDEISILFSIVHDLIPHVPKDTLDAIVYFYKDRADDDRVPTVSKVVHYLMAKAQP
jgi:hypothetical protein